MEYISIKESSMRSKSERRIQQMCKNNEIDAAIKKVEHGSFLLTF